MNHPSTLLLFAGSPPLGDDRFAIVPLGIHALSGYLKARGLEARAIQLHFGAPMGRWTRLLRAIGAREEWRGRFGTRPRALLREIAPGEGLEDLVIFTEQWMSLVTREAPGVVGMTLYEENLACTLILAACLKEALPDTLMIFGGPEVNERNRHLWVRRGLADAAVIGEGEEALFQLLRSRVREARPGEHAGTTGDGGVPVSPLEMAALPIPDFGQLSRSDRLGSALPIAFNRGCVARCDFCQERRFWGGYRQTSVAGAVESIAALKGRYGNDRFVLSQSLMNGDMRWLEAFAEALIERDLEVYWGGNARIHPKMDSAFLEKLYRAGCRFFNFGIESGSGATLKEMGKGVKVDVIARVLETSRRAGIWNHAFWIFGYPGESREELLKTIDFIIANARRIHSHGYHIYNEAEAIGEGHRNLFEYIEALPLRFSRCGEAFAPYRSLAARLFNMEKALAQRTENRAMRWSGPGSREEREREQSRLRRTCHLRELTMRILRASLLEPEVSDVVERRLTPEIFRQLHEELEGDHHGWSSRDPDRFPAALVERLERS